MLSRLLSLLTCLATLSLEHSPADPDGWEDGSDLHHFITRPDLTAPRYKVAKYYPNAIADGYWFVAPYSSLYDQPEFNGRREHVSGQTGAHVYDQDGNLVWSGASKYFNRNVFNFMPVQVNDTHKLSFHLAGSSKDDGLAKESSQIFMDDHYEETGRIQEAARGGPVDFHAFKVLLGGERAIVSMEWWDDGNLTTSEGRKERPILNAGFEEIELKDPYTATFQWDAYQAGLGLDECYDEHGKAQKEGYWDYIHLNSVDKDDDGNYYVSARHTSTIYKISGSDKRIIWRLGGKKSDFEMADETRFWWQHHVRVRGLNATHTILSVFDNASEDQGRNASVPESASHAKIILLDTVNMKASLLRNFERPDKGSSRKLGDVQQLDKGDILESRIFVDWAEQGHVSEYDAGGQMTMEARFVSPRMSSYRAYKFPWTGRPTEKPRCKILPMPMAMESHEISSAFFISWNGATEVQHWEFYGAEDIGGKFRALGTSRKDGFETSFIVPGVVQHGFARAIGRDGEELGRSETVSLVPEDDGAFKHLSEVPDRLRSMLEKNTDSAASTDESESLSVLSILQYIAFFVIFAFAVVGLHTSGKVIWSMTRHRRSGYSSLPLADRRESQLMEATGRSSQSDELAYRGSHEDEKIRMPSSTLASGYSEMSYSGRSPNNVT